jgi:type I restriction enzyme M protein
VTETKALVDKLWNYCNILHDDGLSYGDYLEQLTYLLFLKMAQEQRQLGFGRIVPEGLDWPSLLKLKGERLEAHYIRILNRLGRNGDVLGVVFRKAQNPHPGSGQAGAANQGPDRRRAVDGAWRRRKG